MVIFISIKASPSVSCGPGLGVLVFMGSILTSIVLFFFNFFKTINGNKAFKASSIIHFAGCLSQLIYFFNADAL